MYIVKEKKGGKDRKGEGTRGEERKLTRGEELDRVMGNKYGCKHYVCA